jgi:hypothetical protein
MSGKGKIKIFGTKKSFLAVLTTELAGCSGA